MQTTKAYALDSALDQVAQELSNAATLFRTVDFTSINASTRYTIILALGQGLDESPVADPPYVRDTGVTVCGTNVGPGTRQVGTVYSSINVKSTRVKFSLRWRHNPSGTEGDLNLADQVAPVGNYYPHPSFSIKDPSVQLRSEGKPSPPEVQLIIEPLT